MIKKAIIPIAGLATRFLPLSKVVPKELWPMVDIPSIQYVIQEAKDSGIEEIIFVLRQDNKRVLDYLKPCKKTEKIDTHPINDFPPFTGAILRFYLRMKLFLSRN